MEGRSSAIVHHPLLLRLRQFAEGADQYRIEAALEGDGQPRQTATARFSFTLTDQDQRDLQWYLETYLQYPFDPAPKIAARVEQRMADIGATLFTALFHANDDARELWSMLRPHLDDARVQIVTEVREATTIPWELVRDPRTDVPLALRARSFVRAQPNPVQRPQVPTINGPIRILVVISRPGGAHDVAFRSVATRIIKGLGEEARAVFHLDVLRPPTFDQLARVLRAAKDRGTPYHVVHFDGHGVYGEHDGAGVSISNQMFHRPGKHGHLLFENPALKDNHELINGIALGNLLVETDVPVLVLNACRSAHADDRQPATGDEVADEHQSDGPNPPAQRADPHQQVRAFGSLAQEVMDTGVVGVVAMRYNVYVVTAAQFIAELYGTLVEGLTLSEAVTRGRKHLAASPYREVVSAPLWVQDWPVPVVYESAPIALFPRREHTDALSITVRAAGTAPARGNLDPEVAKIQPDVGFFGRDETLLALDRAFDTQPVVLLHAFAGSGKTTTAAEFARWYALTGGVEGPVLFTSFQQYTPLVKVLNDTIGMKFAVDLERIGKHWYAMSVEEKVETTLNVVLKQIPVLWIWDNVEPVAGFPSGTQSAWSVDEQRELADFLRVARTTKAKFLLTSRRDERPWLGDLPRRMPIPPMPMQERVQLARALAEKHGRRITDVQDWRPLLRYTQGNPLTITVLVGQALRDGLKTKDQIEVFVAQLRSGEATFEDQRSEGRSKSLGAALSYGFKGNYSEDERKQLALLHFFQGFVDVNVLITMGHPDGGNLHTLHGLTREEGIVLLDRAAEIGLLTAHGGGYYMIHPALPWYFNDLFMQYYATDDEQQAAARAFVEAMSELGVVYHDQYGSGNRDATINVLQAEEANLLYARQLAHSHDWWYDVIDTMQGLHMLYVHTGRRAEWKRLVDEIVPDFVNMTTDGPLPDREEAWGLVTQYRVGLAQEERHWAEAERLQQAQVTWCRQRAASALTVPVEALDGGQRHAIRTLAVSISVMGHILREQGKPECAATYEETIPLYQHIGDQPGVAITAYNLGHAYINIPALRDLEQAEYWCRRSLELRDERDRLGRARGLGQLGFVAYERFKEALTAQQPEDKLLRHIHILINAALNFYYDALNLLPPHAVNDLAVMHNQLGLIFTQAVDFDRALPHYRDAIRYHESAGNLYAAAQTRCNVAGALAQAGRFEDALLYAQAALRNFEPYGVGAAEMIRDTQKFITWITEQMQGG